jgi:cysteinyl-tRNA synthetase
MRAIRLHDTRSGEVRPLDPRDPGRVAIYACGPTVYNRIHVGNGRPYVVFSLLKRFLEHEGLDVTLVINVTDVNDKIYDAANAAGVPSAELAREMTAQYRADTDALDLGRPDAEPLASETIEPIVELIGALIERGHAYVAEGDVFFRVRSDEAYGSLSHRRLEDMDQGEEREGAQRKEDAVDFALWKAQKPGEDTAWDAPWGRGRPGWHIECSAMAEELLGLDFEIHGGGSDLVFPHHENEAAQTRAGRGTELARLWVHNGMLQVAAEEGAEGDKMSKSVGNIVGLGDAVAQVGRDALVMYFCGGHYRQPIVYRQDVLEQAQANVARIREAARATVAGPSPSDMAAFREDFLDSLADDFNTPQALAAVFGWVREANRRGGGVGHDDLREMLGLLGLDNLLDDPVGAGPDASALALLAERERARAQRDFTEADRLRDELLAMGWQVRDGPEGPELVPLAG